jgi:hypothetical protein
MVGEKTPEEIAAKVCPHRGDTGHLSCRLCARIAKELQDADLENNNSIANSVFTALWLQVDDMQLIRIVRKIRQQGVS